MSGFHKDFHGYHNFILRYVERQYGREFMLDGLRRIGKNVYVPVAKRLAREGLAHLAEYWKEIFDLEGGEYEITLQNDQLTLTVKECPAIHYIKSKNWPLAGGFCEHTRIVNEEICRKTGYQCSVEYNQEKGSCVQKFWKETSQ